MKKLYKAVICLAVAAMAMIVCAAPRAGAKAKTREVSALISSELVDYKSAVTTEQTASAEAPAVTDQPSDSGLSPVTVRITVKPDGRTVIKCRGVKLAKKFIITEKHTYYCRTNDGVATRGWIKLGKHYYYFDRDTARMKKGQKVNGIRINKKGYAVKKKMKKCTVGRRGHMKTAVRDVNAYKIDTMIQARKIYRKLTNYGDSKARKKKKCLDYVLIIHYKQYRTFKDIGSYTDPTWSAQFARDIFNTDHGDCISDAAAFAYLLVECGYKNVYVETDTGHGWMRLGDKVYDPLFGKVESKGPRYLGMDKREYYGRDRAMFRQRID